MNIYGWCEWNSNRQNSIVIPGIKTWLQHTERVIITRQQGLDFHNGAIASFSNYLIPGAKLFNGVSGFINELDNPKDWTTYSKYIIKACNDCKINIFVHECEDRFFIDNKIPNINWGLIRKGLNYLPKKIEHWFYPLPRIASNNRLFLSYAKEILPNIKITDQTQGYINTWDLPISIHKRQGINIPLIPILYCYGETENIWSWREQDVLGQISKLNYNTNIIYPGQKNFENAGREIFKSR